MSETFEQKVIRFWKESPKLRPDFRDILCYAGYLRAVESGRVKVMRQGYDGEGVDRGTQTA